MDYRLFQALNSLAGHYDRIDDTFEVIASYAPVLFAALLVALWFWPGVQSNRDGRQWACIAATASVLLALGLNQLIILLWNRPRPIAAHSAVVLLSPSHDPSFPSDHATFAFAVAVSILLSSRRVGIGALGLATLLAFSRVYVGEHYVGDVLAGAVIGTVVAVLVNQLRPVIFPRLDPLMRLARHMRLA